MVKSLMDYSSQASVKKMSGMCHKPGIAPSQSLLPNFSMPRRSTLRHAQYCPILDSPAARTLYVRHQFRARSSAGEHRLHTAGVVGSIPTAPTIYSCSSVTAQIKLSLSVSNSLCDCVAHFLSAGRSAKIAG
jgi:hypothetical protein